MTSILASKAVLASLSLSRWNGHRVDKAVTAKVNRDNHAAVDAGRYNKKLVSTDQMAPVLAEVTAARNYHYKMTLPWMDEGARILPSKVFLEYTEHMRERRIAFQKAADDFIAAYPSYVLDAQTRLGTLFDAADYPSACDLKSMFDFDVAILPCPDTDDFRIAVGAEHADDIRRDLERRMTETMNAATKDKMAKVAEVVGNMVERLRAYDPGDKDKKATGTFRDSLVDNVREIARLLPSFNLNDDPTMAKLHQRIEKELCKHDPDTLRTDTAARESTAKSAEVILDSISDFIG